jgi:hypothetical protein
MATRERYTLGRTTLRGDDVEYGVEVGTQGAKLVCVEADLKLSERAAFCQDILS